MKNDIKLSFSILTIAALFLLPLVAYARPMSPFVGHWQAIDTDGSDIRLTIAGPPGGPFQITWTESHISSCNGEPGIGRGSGLLSQADAYLLEADLRLECFTTGASLDFHLDFRYHPATNILSARYENGMVVVWHRPGHPPPPQPTLDLRVNYGHDWVESFYEAGHTVWVTVTESDGVTVKASAELVTESKDFWGGETGFATQVEDWDPAPPDIQPYDWVYGWVDNGASSQVQIGEINGAIDLEANSIRGTVRADWFAEELYIVCDPWGLSDLTQYRESSAYPDGVDEFECSWSGVLDILPGQELGVWYFGPDGHAVANAFSTPDGRVIAFPEADNVFGYGWPEGSEVYMDISGSVNFPMLTTVGPAPWDENDILAYFDFNGLYDLVPGDVVTLSGSGIVETHTVRNLGVTGIDAGANSVSGVADDGEIPYVYLFEYPDQVINPAVESGQWIGDFNSVGLDLLGGMCGRVDIWDELGNSTTVDWCVPNPRIIAHPDQEWVEGWAFLDGAAVELTIYDAGGALLYQHVALAASPEWDPGNPDSYVQFDVGYDLKAGDHLWMTDRASTKELIVTALMPAGIDPGGQIVYGVAEPYSEVTLEHEGEMWTVTAAPEGNWSATLPKLVRGSVALASQWDGDGDMTRIAFHIPNTRFTFFPEWNYLEGYEWPDGAVVSISVAGKEVCSTEAVSGFPEWDPWNTFFSANFPEGCEIGAGDLITLSSESLILTHQVPALAITAVNLDNSTVAGTAVFDPEEYILHTWIHGVDESYMQLSAEGGAWLADFGSQGFILQPGMGGRVELVDQASNATAVEWWIPNPHFTVFPEWEWMDGYEWPDGPVVVTVEGKLECSNEKTSEGGFFNGPFPEGCDLMVGDMVTFTDGMTTRTHIVQNLAISAVDKVVDTVSGTADAGAVLHVWPHEFGEFELQPTAEVDGTWLADFAAVGFDLLDGTCGRAEIRDDAGNATAMDWCVPQP